MNYHMGLDGFVWFIGVVENRNDPSQMGRVQVRCISFHTDNKNDLPTEDLPWATTMLPTTASGNSGLGSNPFLAEGTWVLGFFLDAKTKQQPVILGTLPGKPSSLGETAKGFNDPNSRPAPEIGVSVYPKVAGEPDIDKLARGENTIDKTTNLTKDVNLANSSTTWSEPDSAYKTTYPYNRVFKSETGHVKEYDDTEGEERIHEYHKAGTFYEIDKDGNKTTRIVKDNYEIIAGTNYVNVKGDVNLTIDSNCNTYVKGNWNIQVDGNVIENIKGTYDQNVTGAATMDAKTINLNSGTKGAARLDDTVDTGDDPAGISGSDGSNKIETSSTTVIIGD